MEMCVAELVDLWAEEVRVYGELGARVKRKK
jgi:hypothetical protein